MVAFRAALTSSMLSLPSVLAQDVLQCPQESGSSGESSSMLQLNGARQLGTEAPGSSASSCSVMTNMVTHFTIDLGMGSPEQIMSVIADTGSDTLVVVDCSCLELGACPANTKCYFGWNASSTFELSRDSGGAPNAAKISYGSGSVSGVTATEMVRVGTVTSNIKEGVLLVAETALNLGEDSVFEGILGLGMPKRKEKIRDASTTDDNYEYSNMPETFNEQIAMVSSRNAGDDLVHAIEDNIEHQIERRVEIRTRRALQRKQRRNINGKGRVRSLEQAEIKKILSRSGQLGVQDTMSKAIAKQAGGPTDAAAEATAGDDVSIEDTASGAGSGVLWQAGVERFEMCFNHQDGALRLNHPQPGKKLGNVGTHHWGLGLDGVRVGDEVMPICNNLTRKGQETPCAAIPDSGTTLLTGPERQVALMFETLCDKWDRCRKNHTALERAKNASVDAATKTYGINPFEFEVWAKWQTFKLVLSDCDQWSSGRPNLSEMPSIEFSVAGSDGEVQTLEFSPWSYIIESDIPAEEGNISSVLKASSMLETVGVSKGMPRWMRPCSWFGTCSHPTQTTTNTLSDKTETDIDMPKKNFSGKTLRVCEPAFGTMEYDTQLNGPVWILGASLFYEYAVGFELDANNMAMSFKKLSQDEPCNSCSGPNSSSTLSLTQSGPRQLRHLSKPPRTGKYDTSKPL